MNLNRSSKLAYQLRNPSKPSIITKSLLVLLLSWSWPSRRSQKISLDFSFYPPQSPSRLSLTSSAPLQFAGVGASRWAPRIAPLSHSDQKGIQLLILPDVSAGYPSIFFPDSLAQQPQKIAAGQQIICTVVVRVWSLGLRSSSEAYRKENAYDEAQGRSNDLDMARVLILRIRSVYGRDGRRG